MLHKAVIAACGGQAGVADGLIADPRTCNFDPASIECEKGATSTNNCLTAAEVATASKIYGGPVDATTGQRMLAGSPQFGLEVPTTNSTDAPGPVTSLFSYMIVSGAYNLLGRLW